MVRYKHGSFWKPAIVVSTHAATHLYIIKMSNRRFLRRNRSHLKKTNESVTVISSYYDDDDVDDRASQQLLADHQQNAQLPSNPVPDATEKRSTQIWQIDITPPVRYQND